MEIGKSAALFNSRSAVFRVFDVRLFQNKFSLRRWRRRRHTSLILQQFKNKTFPARADILRILNQ
jgi:hypothetical protein